MEAVPRLPMLAIDMKQNPQKMFPFGPDLAILIRDTFKEEPDNFKTEIETFEKLRTAALNPSKSREGCAVLTKYFCQLYFLRKRFPSIKHGPEATDISWKDLWTPNQNSSGNRRMIHYGVEFAMTLFNIGALHSQVGACDDRSTEEGLKLACTHFQCAAYAFHFLQDRLWSSKQSDFEPGLFQFLVPLCLAQAQECIMEKSMKDNRKPLISAKVASKIAEFYGTAKRALADDSNETPKVSVSVKNFHDWKNYVKYKEAYFTCLAYFFMGLDAEEGEKWGERVALYDKAADFLAVAANLVKEYLEVADLLKGVPEALAFTSDVVFGKKKISASENDFIYHAAIPCKQTLKLVKGAPLVKCLEFSFTDPEVAGPDIFAKLVSMKVHKLASIYSEEKAKLLRDVSARVEEKDRELMTAMSAYRLDYLDGLEEELEDLDDDFVERCAYIQAHPEIGEEFAGAANRLLDLHKEVEGALEEMGRLIEAEESAEKEFQESLGSRSPSIVSTDLKYEAAKYKEALEKATKSNEALRKAMTVYGETLELMSKPVEDIQRSLPQFEHEFTSTERVAFEELRELRAKVEEMEDQREALMLKLRESLNKDDISSVLMLSDSDGEALMKRELAKHEGLTKVLDQNFTAQGNILRAMSRAYGYYAPIRDIAAEVCDQRRNAMRNMVEICDMLDDVLGKAEKGAEFYEKLEGNVKKLLQRVKGTCKVQEEERLQMYSKAQEATAAAAKPQEETPKLKDFLSTRKSYDPPTPGYFASGTFAPVAAANYAPNAAVRLPPVGSEMDAPVMSQLDSKYYEARLGEVGTVKSDAVGNRGNQSMVDYGSGQGVARGNPQNSGSYPYGAAPTSYTTGARSLARTPAYSASYHAVVPQGTGMPLQGAGMSQGYGELVQSDNRRSMGTSSSSSLTGYLGYGSTTRPGGNYGANAASANYDSGISGSGNYGSHTPAVTSSIDYSYNMTATPGYGSNFTNPVAAHGTVPATSANYGPNMMSTNANYGSNIAANAKYGSNLATNASYVSNRAANTNMTSNTGNIPVSANSSMASNVNYFNPNAGGSSNYWQGHFPGGASSPSFSNRNAPFAPAYGSYATAGRPSTFQIASTDLSGDGRSYAAQYGQGMIQGQGVAQRQGFHGAGILQGQGVHGPQSQGVHGPQSQGVHGPQSQGVHGPQSQGVHGPQSQGVHEPQSQEVHGPQSQGVQNNQGNCHEGQGISQGSGVAQHLRSVAAHQRQIQHAIVPHSQGVSSAVSQMYYSSQYGQQGGSWDGYPKQQSNMDSLTYTQSNNNGGMNTTQSGGGGGQKEAQKKEEVEKVAEPAVKEEKSEPSSIDLLSDLDFSVSQIPLKPMTVDDEVVAKELREVKLEEKEAISPPLRERPAKRVPVTNPFLDVEIVEKFVQEAEKFEKFVDRLQVKTLNGPTPIDTIWNDYRAQQEKFSKMNGCEMAAKYPGKNRSADILPYDGSRVIVPNVDYINASLVKNFSPFVPDIIITQTPMRETRGDFWNMIWAKEIEMIVCLATDTDLADDFYFPKEKNEKCDFGGVTLTLHSANVQTGWTERIMSVSKGNATLVLTHLQLTAWPEGSLPLPKSPAILVDLASECANGYRVQRDLKHELVIHCRLGVGLSGVFASCLASICEISGAGKGALPDLTLTLGLISECRKNVIADKEHLQLAYQAVKYYAQHVLVKCGKRTAITDGKSDQPTRSEGSGGGKGHSRKASAEMFNNSVGNLAECAEKGQKKDDPLSSIDPLWLIKKDAK